MPKFIHMEIKSLDKCPDNWTTVSSWPGPGFYRVATEDWQYIVTKTQVNIFYDGMPEGAVIDERAPGAGISETLLLQAIAAASHAKVLS